MRIAFICRFGHQDFYRVTGRDPARSPMTFDELQLFERALLEHWKAECEPKAGLGLPQP